MKQQKKQKRFDHTLSQPMTNPQPSSKQAYTVYMAVHLLGEEGLQKLVSVAQQLRVLFLVENIQAADHCLQTCTHK